MNESSDVLEGVSSPLPHGRTRRRAAVACRQCSMRKVRCDVSISGVPCGNCSRDHTLCKIVPRKKRRGRNAVVRPEASTDTRNPPDLESPQGYRSDAPVVETISQFVQQTPMASSGTGRPSSMEDTGMQPSPLTDGNSPAHQEVVVNDYAQGISSASHSYKEMSSGLFYFGGRQGLGGFMFDICEGPAVPRNSHYLLPLLKNTTLSTPEKEYLKSTGAFTLPPPDICNALLRCYFQNVHQLLPIIDVQSFLVEYLHHGTDRMSLLLLWGIFFASSNFIDQGALEKAGFTTRKAWKRDLYRRAKALYDCDYEKDKITLIQSVILIGLWYNDTDDRNGAWHWIGVAISLSQSVGLHRQVRLADPSHTIPKRREYLYRRIWWTCLVRDRWLSLSKGQSMRIHTADCDIAMPTALDITAEINTMDPELRREYIPWDPNALARLWLRLVTISKALGSILAVHDNVDGSKPCVEDIQTCEEEIAVNSIDSVDLGYTDPMMRLFASQLRLLHEATVVVLYRPYIFQGPSHPDSTVTKLWQQKSLEKTRTSAATATQILEGLLEIDVVKHLKPMTITALIPAMQIHLMDCKSSNTLVRRFAQQKLDVCMLVMSELRHTYWGADFVFEMFHRAQIKMSEKLETPLSEQRAPASTVAEPEMPALAVHTIEPANDHDILWTSRPTNPGDVLEGASHYGELSHTTPFAYETEVDDSFQLLLNSNDFGNLFLNMI